MQLQQPRPEDSPTPNLRPPAPELRPEAILEAIRPALTATIPVFFLTLLLRASPNALLAYLLLALPFVLAPYFGARHRDWRLAAFAGAAFVLIVPGLPILTLVPILAGMAVAASYVRHNLRRGPS